MQSPSEYYIRAITKSGTIPSTVYLDNTSASSDESKESLFNQYFYTQSFLHPTKSPTMHACQFISQLDSARITGLQRRRGVCCSCSAGSQQSYWHRQNQSKGPQALCQLFSTQYAIYSTLVYQLVLFPLNGKFI